LEFLTQKIHECIGKLFYYYYYYNIELLLLLLLLFSLGPSGPNSEYLLNLASALRTIAPNAHDAHLFDLEERLLELIKKSSYL
jgi:hypothetical protein